jgi:hypothetical protein
MSAPGREATQDYSRGVSPHPGARPRLAGPRALLLLSALSAGGLLIAADLSPLYEVDVLTVTKATIAGHAQHSYALLLVGLGVLPLALAAPRSRPARVALAVLGLLVLAIAAIAGDFHDVHSTGAIGQLYESATAKPRAGFYLETLGAVLLLAGGLGGLLLPDRPRPAAAGAGPAAGAGAGPAAGAGAGASPGGPGAAP